MFKKRSRPTAIRQKDESAAQAEAVESGTSTPGEDSAHAPKASGNEEGDEENGLTVDELIQLRKLRKAKQGIELAKLNRGEHKVADTLGASEKYGLQSQKAGQENDWMNEAERVKNRVRSNAFTQQTNALDVDKHMLAYIEEELQKRRGKATDGKPVDLKSLDPEDELYKLAEKYNVEPRKIGEDEEGNVTNSMGMLTSIPEIDLGMENRLKNIEATERAKREMMELRKADMARRNKSQDAGYAAARYHLPNLRVASDVYAMDEEKRQAAGLPPPARPREGPEQATDEQVYERFKKRMKR